MWELRVAEARGRLIDWDDLSMEATRFVVALRSRLMALPLAQAPRLALMTDPVEIEQLLRGEIVQMLTEMSKWTALKQDPTPAKKRGKK